MPNLNDRRDGAGAVLTRWRAFADASSRLLRLIFPYFTVKETRSRTFVQCLIIISLLYLSTEITAYISDVFEQFVNANSGGEYSVPQTMLGAVATWLSHFGLSLGVSWLVMFLVLLAGVDVVQSEGQYLQNCFSANLREFLAGRLFKAQSAPLVASRMQRTDIASDQIMTDNARDFPALFVTLTIAAANAVVGMAVWTPYLWAKSPFLTEVSYGWSLFVSIATIWIGKPMLPLTNVYNDREAELRFIAQEMKREAEAIAFARAEGRVFELAMLRLKSVVASQKAMFGRGRLVQYFSTYANGLVPWMAPVLLVPFAVHGGVGAMMAAQLGVASLFGALGFVVNQFVTISTFLTQGKRLGTLEDAQRGYLQRPLPDGGIAITTGEGITFEGVTLRSDDGKAVYLSDLNFTLPKGASICVLSEDRAAKMAFMRLIDRHTNAGAGRARLPDRSEIVFLTEDPYLTESTLRQALTYDCPTCPPQDKQIEAVLEQVGLSKLVQRFGLDTEQAWRTLVPDELQRLNLARALFMQKSYVVLEQSALPDQEVDRFFKMLVRPGTGIISLANSVELAKLHDWVLYWDGSASKWMFIPASEYHQPDKKADASCALADAANRAGLSRSQQWVLSWDETGGEWTVTNKNERSGSEAGAGSTRSQP